jgi:hypothetical protein
MNAPRSTKLFNALNRRADRVRGILRRRHLGLPHYRLESAATLSLLSILSAPQPRIGSLARRSSPARGQLPWARSAVHFFIRASRATFTRSFEFAAMRARWHVGRFLARRGPFEPIQPRRHLVEPPRRVEPRFQFRSRDRARAARRFRRRLAFQDRCTSLGGSREPEMAAPPRTGPSGLLVTPPGPIVAAVHPAAQSEHSCDARRRSMPCSSDATSPAYRTSGGVARIECFSLGRVGL